MAGSSSSSLRSQLFGNRSAGGGGGQGSYAPVSTSDSSSAAAQQSEELFLQQNERIVSHLDSRVGKLKDLSIAINEEVKSQNAMLDSMDGDMSGAGSLLKSTIGAIDEMVSAGGSKHLCYLTLFIFVFFLLVYKMM